LKQLTSDNTILFVYGSLKRGEENHHLMAGQTFLARAVTAPKYRLYSLGRYPGLVHDGECGQSIHGELWSVAPSKLEALDEFEGSPDHFRREPIELLGWTDDVEAYFYQRRIPEGAASGIRWPWEPQ
jgi:gamma-glutamylaminecyclotransferase